MSLTFVWLKSGHRTSDNIPMALMWFVQKDEVVEGPLSADEVQARLQSGQLSAQNMIWGRGMPAWQRVQWWMNEMPRLATAEVAQVVAETWHYALNGKSHGPYVRDAFIHELKHIENLGDVMVWTKGMKEWAALFEFHDLLTSIGVNKRQFPRADLTGRAVLKTDESTLIAPLLTVSEGGCGVGLAAGLVPGQVVTLEMQSPSFREVLNARAEVRYIVEGICGLRFTQMSSETRGAIVQLVRQNQTRFVLKAS